MPSKRSVRTRNRRTAALTPAEFQWLTGEPQEGVNKYEWLEIELPTNPEDLDKLDSVLERGAELVPAARLEWLRAELRVWRRRREQPRMEEYEDDDE